MQRILIFANGVLPDVEAARELLQEGDVILAADGGTRHVLALGRMPDAVVGDLDSISSEERRKVEESGVEVLEYPQDKNETDLELAIEHALSKNPAQIIIVAALGRRIDQTLGNLSLLTDPRLQAVDTRLDDGVEEILLCRDQVRVKGRRGDLVSLIPWGSEVKGVFTENLKWPLAGESLFQNRTRGISNELLGEEASIRIDSGSLLVVHRRTDDRSTRFSYGDIS